MRCLIYLIQNHSMKVYLTLFLILLGLTSCKELEDPVGYEDVPYFYVKGNFFNNQQIEAGRKNYFHYTRHQKDVNNVYEYIAELKNDSCENCDEEFKLIIRASHPVDNPSEINILESIKEGNYDYAQNLNLSRHRRVQFVTDTTINPISNYIWDFGDGTVSLEKQPKHVYQKDSVYTVQMIYNQGSCTNITQKTLQVYPDSTNAICNADFGYNLTNNTITCSGNDSTYGAQFLWQFGDGHTSTDINPTHTYLTPGFYPITLNINRVGLGCKSMVMKTVDISPGSANCQTNFHYHEAKPSSVDSLHLLKVIIEYTSKDGTVYRTDNIAQDNPLFYMSNIEAYENNDLNEPVIVFNVDFSCKLINSAGGILEWNNYKARLGVSYPR
jgi:PKD domain